MKNIFFVFLMVLGVCSTTYAQDENHKWSLGIHAGSQQYNGDLRNQFFKLGDDHNGYVGFSISRYLSKHLDITTDLSLGDLKVKNKDNEDFAIDYNMNQANFRLRYNFLEETVKFRPYLSAGVGVILFNSLQNDDNAMALPVVAGGVKYRINDIVSMRLQMTYHASDNDDTDFLTDGTNESYLQTSLGLVAKITSKQDGDNDGVSDKKDKCLATAPGVKVNKDGCAVDRDNDGIVNEEDKCPDVAGKAEMGGCPDSDADGLADKDDACPNVAGSKEMGGCPDSDGDGVIDSEDKCPNKEGLAELKGCPKEKIIEDVYKTGIYTYNKLPASNTALLVLDENGNVIDTVYTDENGAFKFKVLDPDANYMIKPLDAPKDNSLVDIFLTGKNGNRIEDGSRRTGGEYEFGKKKKETKVSSKVTADMLTTILYNSESSSINIKYYKQLDRLAVALKENSNISLNISGYADSSGPIEYNKRLSVNRADRVKKYLIRKGVKTSQLNANGKGTDNPAVSNETPEGRAKNRRVELSL